jgi:hypothetical protein
MSRSATQFAISIDELKELANVQIRAIAQHLLPNGRENCGYWEAGSIEGEPGKSLKVNLRGATRGLWTDFSAAKGSPSYSGNVIQLVAQVQFGGNVGEACKWLRRWLGIDNLDPEALAKSKATAQRAAASADKDAVERAEKNRRRAHQLFLSADPYPDTIVETYLCSRGIDFRKADLNAPGAIRYAPRAYCAEVRKDLPAMVAPIVGLDGRHLGTHRTWLAPDGVGKAMLVEAKKSIGKYQGGFIPLWKGQHKCALKDLPPSTPIYISEGIEDGLSVALARPSLRIIAGVSLSNIGSIELPDGCPAYLLAQRDEKMKAIEAFEGALARLQERGYAVFLVYPPAGFKDYNDVLRGTPRDEPGGNNGEE